MSKWTKKKGDNVYELSLTGDKRFSPFIAQLKDGRYIQQAFQLDVKGYGKITDDWKNIHEERPYTNKKGQMVFRYGKDKRPGVKATDTFTAIKFGERTATTRYHRDGKIDYWKYLQKDDNIEFFNNKEESLFVKVTKEPYFLDFDKPHDDDFYEDWSRLEGWSLELARSRTGTAIQFQYKYLDLYKEYKNLWLQWAKENPELIQQLFEISQYKLLADDSKITDLICPARCLSEILNSSNNGEILL